MMNNMPPIRRTSGTKLLVMACFWLAHGTSAQANPAPLPKDFHDVCQCLCGYGKDNDLLVTDRGGEDFHWNYPLITDTGPCERKTGVCWGYIVNSEYDNVKGWLKGCHLVPVENKTQLPETKLPKTQIKLPPM